MQEWSHTPVLVEEALTNLSPAFTLLGNATGEGALFVDATCGEGGHTEAFLKRYSNLRVLGLDADGDILEIARRRLASFAERLTLRHTWADDFFSHCTDAERPLIILIDLGISMFHYRKSGRGFSLERDEPLDMRIDPTRGESAASLLSRLNEKELADLLFRYGEERYSRRIARAIVERRQDTPITRATQLADITQNAVPPIARHRHIHPATRTFQALRIAANQELERLPGLLAAALGCLPVGGRLAVITFHSLEDRIVKRYFREMAKDCVCPPDAPRCTCRGHRIARLITTKPLAPTAAEVSANPSSRSAKLRVVEKVALQ